MPICHSLSFLWGLQEITSPLVCLHNKEVRGAECVGSISKTSGSSACSVCSGRDEKCISATIKVKTELFEEKKWIPSESSTDLHQCFAVWVFFEKRINPYCTRKKWDGIWPI